MQELELDDDVWNRGKIDRYEELLEDHANHPGMGASANQRLERFNIAPLHGGLDFQSQSVASDRQHSFDDPSVAVNDVCITGIEAAFDLRAIKSLGVPDISERDVVMLTPKKRDISTRPSPEHRSCDRLSMTYGNLPVLDANELSIPGIPGNVTSCPNAWRRA